MTARQVASLALKLIGVWLMVYFIGQSSFFFVFSLSHGILTDLLDVKTPATTMAYVAFAGGFIFMCGYMIAKSDRLAERMVDDENNLTLAPGLDGQDIQAIIFSCIGVVLLAQAILDLPNIFASFLYFSSNRSLLISSTVRFVIRAVLGLVLFLQGRGLARFWQMLRS